jgi:sterol desaturase/sphingolipid hydroxylase (fatty acid hydroxylase superfamily)
MSWIAQHLRLFSVNMARGFVFVAIAFCLIYTIETLTRERTSQYRTRNFWNDLAYWFYYSSGTHDFLVNVALFSFLGAQIAGWNLHLERRLDPVTHYILYWIVLDFLGYWTHRLMHAHPKLWAFHMLHHSQETLTFATGVRIHPVENVIYYAIKFVPLAVMGGAPAVWVPLQYVLRLIPDFFQHSEIAWKMGPLYRVLVSPTFHSFHHSLDPRYFDKNFGISLSCWDFLFGTGVDEDKRNHAYGLDGVRWPTFREQLWNPFVIAFSSRSSPPAAEPEEFANATQPGVEKYGD